MSPPVKSFLQELPRYRAALAADADAGLRALRQVVRGQRVHGFEIDLLARVLREFDASQVTAMPMCRLAVLASHTSEPIANAARVALLGEGFLGEIYESPFGSYWQELLDPGSGLYSFQPDLVLIAASPADRAEFPESSQSSEQVEGSLQQHLRTWEHAWSLLASRLGKPLLQHLAEIPEHEFMGTAERRAAWAPARFVEALNARSLDLAPGFVHWLDVDRLAARVGRQNWHDLALLHHAQFPFSPKFLPEYTKLLSAGLRSALGRTPKALIVDLDNTLWGGVIGDEGLDGIRLGPDSAEGRAYESFARYVKELSRRGVVLGICSKNDHATAAEVFERHPHMPLRLTDFAVVRCNWLDKAANLVTIARELNVDVSALVMVDDNPAECELIRQALPEVHTVLLDGDPSLFTRTLEQQRLFDVQAFSSEDFVRGASYQARSKFLELQEQATDLRAYLASLDMTAQIAAATPGDLPRLAQMEMKTNQFNVATRRLTVDNLQAMSQAPGVAVFVVRFADRFADHGVVSYLAARTVGRTLTITDWLMSCRVFSRTLEQFMFNHLVDWASDAGVRRIEATIVPTNRNMMMKAVFESLGLVSTQSTPEGPWHYELVAGRTPLESFVNERGDSVGNDQ